MTDEEVQTLLASDESDTIERKAGVNPDEIKRALIAFANDLAQRGTAFLILGQSPNKTIVGLEGDKDRIQQKIASIASNSCRPTVPVSVSVFDLEGKTVAIVEVRASIARPHFAGKSFVRVGSTTREATEAEIILLRSMTQNRKIGLLRSFIEKGKTEVVLHTVRPLHRERAFLADVTEDWVVLQIGNRKEGISYSELEVGYDYGKDRPIIRYLPHGS